MVCDLVSDLEIKISSDVFVYLDLSIIKGRNREIEANININLVTRVYEEERLRGILISIVHPALWNKRAGEEPVKVTKTFKFVQEVSRSH